MYNVNFNTGAGNKNEIETLQKAMEAADKGASYTQENITIENTTTGETIAMRKWYGCTEGIEDIDNPIQFGDFGFYGDWVVL